MRQLGFALAALCAWALPALAQPADVKATVSATTLTVSGKLTITVTAPLNFTFSPAALSISCTAPAGSLVGTMVPTGGDGARDQLCDNRRRRDQLRDQRRDDRRRFQRHRALALPHHPRRHEHDHRDRHRQPILA